MISKVSPSLVGACCVMGKTYRHSLLNSPYQKYKSSSNYIQNLSKSPCQMCLATKQASHFKAEYAPLSLQNKRILFVFSLFWFGFMLLVCILHTNGILYSCFFFGLLRQGLSMLHWPDLELTM